MEHMHCIWGALWMGVVLLLLLCISIFRLQDSWWAVLELTLLPPTPWRKRAIVGGGDLVMFETLQWHNNNNYGDDDRENAIYLSWVLLFMTIFTLPKPLCIPCRCVPCWAVWFQLRWGERAHQPLCLWPCPERWLFLVSWLAARLNKRACWFPNIMLCWGWNQSCLE